MLVERPTVRDYMKYELITIAGGMAVTGYFMVKNIRLSEWNYLVANTMIMAGLVFGARALEVEDYIISQLRSR